MCYRFDFTRARCADSLAQQRLFLSRDGRCSEGFEFEHHPIHPWLEHIQFNKLRWIEPTPIEMNEKKEESQKRKTTCINWVIADPVESPLALPPRLINSSSRSIWHLTSYKFEFKSSNIYRNKLLGKLHGTYNYLTHTYLNKLLGSCCWLDFSTSSELLVVISIFQLNFFIYLIELTKETLRLYYYSKSS